MLYGATPIEDIPYYNVIVRQLTEWTSSSSNLTFDEKSISEGIGGAYHSEGVTFQANNTLTSISNTIATRHFRQDKIHGIDFRGPGTVTASGVTTFNIDAGAGKVPNASGNQTPIATLTGLTGKIHASETLGRPVRRYQIQLALGLFQQEKLIPTKFMASQLAIEITLENALACMYYLPSTTFTTQPGTATTVGTPSSTPPSYIVKNVNLIPEILEFDASYDETFLRGLQTGGVPIKFCTWNNYRFSQTGTASINLQIQERSRSVKAIFAMLRRDPPTFATDSGACFFNTATNAGVGIAGGLSTLQEYQFRIGGRYFPAQPVQLATEVGGLVPNGGCEAFVELQKALNTLGQNNTKTGLNTMRWAVNPFSTDSTIGSTAFTNHSEYDFDYQFLRYASSGSPLCVLRAARTSASQDGNAECGNMGSACFAMAIDLETSNGLEISGLNAEEQSDISLIARYSAAQEAGFVYDVFTYIDSMIVLRENNVLELIQ